MKLSEIWRKHSWKLIAAILLIAITAWYIYGHHQEWSRERIMAYGKGLPVGWFLFAFAVLPLLGFPISILLVLMGIRFGMGWGMAIAAGGVAIHHVAAFYLTHGWFRTKLRQKLEASGYGIPKIDEKRRVWYTILFAAIHGPPYALKLYLLALTEIPFRIYFLAGAPIYWLFCLVPIGAGSAVMSFDPTWVYILITAMALLTFGGHWLKKKYSPGNSSAKQHKN